MEKLFKMLQKIGKGMLKVLLWAIGILAAILIPTIMIGEYHDNRFGTDLIYRTENYLGGIAIVSIVLLMGLAKYLFFIKNPQNRVAERLCQLSKRKKRIVMVAATVILISVNVFCAQWTNYFTPDGVIIATPFKTKEFTWKDADSFELKSDRDGVLMFVIYMKNGKRYSFNGGFLGGVVYMSDSYTERFEDDVRDYMPYVAGKLKEAGASMKTEKWYKLMHKLDNDMWKQCAENVRSVYEGN